jgi:EmrB/QacA subfamily drug resistance transporter
MNKLWSLVGISLGSFITLLSLSMVNAILPYIQRDFITKLDELLWVMNIFIFFVCISIVPLHRIATSCGRKKVYLFGIILFAIASIGSFFSPTIECLLVFRAVQGIATGAIIPCVIFLLYEIFPDEKERHRSICIWMLLSFIGLSLGSILGGVVVTYFSWRVAFLINIVMSIITYIICFCGMRKMEDIKTPVKSDWVGFVFLSLALSCLMVSIVQGESWGWSSMHIHLLFISSFLLLVIYYYIERKVANPIISFSFFRSPMFFIATTVYFVLVCFIYCEFFFLPLYLYTLLHISPVMSGVSLMLIGVMVAIFSFVSKGLVMKYGPKSPTIIGLIALMSSAGLQVFFNLSTSLWFVMIAVILFGMAWGLAYNPVKMLAKSSLPVRFAIGADETIRVVGSMGGVVGLACAGAIFKFRDRLVLTKLFLENDVVINASERKLIKSLMVEPKKVQSILDPLFEGKGFVLLQDFQEAFLAGFNSVAWLLMLIAFVSFVCVCLIYIWPIYQSKQSVHMK